MSVTFTKKLLMNAYARGVTMDGLQGNRLYLVTANGIIIGQPVFEKEENDVNVRVIQGLIEGATKAVAEAEPERLPKDVFPEYLVLKDVRIEKNGVVSARFPVLTVFCDQIIGMTIGNTNSSNG